MRKAIEDKNLCHLIEMVGMVDPEQMHKWMQASDLLLLPSYEEGMPNAVMEAMACGLPVVATTVGGLPEAVGDCEGVILVPPRDVDRFKDAVLKVLRNEQLRERMGLAARKRAEERFGIQRNARRILDFLSEIIERNRRQIGPP